MEFHEVAGQRIEVPAKIRTQGRDAVAAFVADELVSKQAIPLDPTKVTVAEIREAVGPETDDSAVEGLLHVERRVTAREHLRECHSALASEEEQEEDAEPAEAEEEAPAGSQGLEEEG